ncbi:hypothetical protein NMY22_g12315 [Coprinellus aureogranulatus]|nr:hypothetical protein NMY22_g12315 [Coprinellus aureogranulatus]
MPTKHLAMFPRGILDLILGYGAQGSRKECLRALKCAIQHAAHSSPCARSASSRKQLFSRPQGAIRGRILVLGRRYLESTPEWTSSARGRTFMDFNDYHLTGKLAAHYSPIPVSDKTTVHY